MSKRILFLGAFALLILGIGQSLRERKAALESDFRLQAIRQLSLERVMGVNPEVHGRDVILKGKVISEEEKQRAEEVISQVEGVEQIINTLEVGPRYAPVALYYFLDVAWKEDGINLRGRLPDEGTKTLLLDQATRDFGLPLVTDRLEIDDSLGPGDWLSRIVPLLPLLTEGVSPGRLKATGDRVVLAGIVASEESILELENAARQMLPELEVKSYLRIEDISEEEP